MIHGVWWTMYSVAVATIARRAARDWLDPRESRRVTLIIAGTFAVLFTIAGVLIAVLA